MAYLIAILVALLLLSAFLALTYYETTHGVRFLGRVRSRLDARVGRAAFVAGHVDWSAFILHFVKTASARIAHDIAHATLIIVRVIERLLTRFVKYLRSTRHQAAAVADKPRFDLRESLAQFRRTLRKKPRELTEGE